VGYLFIRPYNGLPMTTIVAVGNPLRGDDGAGIYVGKLLEGRLPVVFAHTAPENFVGVLRRAREPLIFVDAARMGLEPGEFALVDPADVDGIVQTHSVPFSVLVGYLGGKEVLFIGIEPARTDLGEDLTPPVREGCEKVARIILEGRWGEIRRLG